MSGADPSDRTLAERLHGRGDGPDLRGREEELTARAVTLIRRSVPVFEHAPEPFLDVVMIVVGRIVEQALTVLRELRVATRAEVRELVEVCVPPTDQGITLEDMLTVFASAQSVLWDELELQVGQGTVSDPSLALDLGRVGVRLLTDVSRGVTAEYLRGDRVWLQRRDAERALLRGVLQTPSRTEEATRAAHALDLELFGRWRCAVYEPVDPGADPGELLEALEGARQTWGVTGALAMSEGLVVLGTPDDDALPPPTGARVGIGAVHDGPQGLRTSHDEARDALTVARRRGVDSLTVEAARTGRVVLGALSASALADQVLAPIDAEPEGRREMLMETLTAWLDEQGSPSATAARLQLHVQSTRYRIDQLRELLGAAMDDPDQRLQLHLSVRARDLA